jgi:hypothetical protein
MEVSHIEGSERDEDVSSFVQHKNLHNDVNFSNVDDSAEVA